MTKRSRKAKKNTKKPSGVKKEQTVQIIEPSQPSLPILRPIISYQSQVEDHMERQKEENQHLAEDEKEESTQSQQETLENSTNLQGQVEDHDWNFEEEISPKDCEQIQSFTLQNIQGQCSNYNEKLKKLQGNKEIKIYDCYQRKTKYQRDMQELLKAELIAVVNKKITALHEEAFQRPIKVQLKKISIFNKQANRFETRVSLKAIGKKDYFFLEDGLIKGRRFGIITKQLPFRVQNLINKEHSTRACFVGNDCKYRSIVVKGLQQLNVPFNPHEKVDKYIKNQYLDESAPLKQHDYYFFDLDSIVSNIREYNAIMNCSSNPLMKPIYQNKTYREDPQQKEVREEYLQASHPNKKGKRVLNDSQLRATNTIFKKKQGIYLIQGPPGSGKTECIAAYTSLERNFLRQREKNLGFKSLKNKILICASSNAAVNHITRKLLSNQTDWNGERPNILRFGHTEEFNETHLSVNAAHLAEIKVRKTQDNPDDWSAKLRWKKELLQENISRMMVEGISKRDRKIIEAKHELYLTVKRLVEIHHELVAKKQEVDAYLMQLMEKSEIILCTLNTSGMKKFVDFFINRIYCLLIDEASQATEPSTLIPFGTMADKVILVGDHMQLPPTVMNSNSRLTNFNRSMFERLAIRNEPFLLDIQYRMTKEIMDFPCRQFYQGKLKYGRTKPVPQSLQALKSSTMFINVAYGQETESKKSFLNEEEASCVSFAAKHFVNCDPNLTIGIITPYRPQAKLIENEISSLELTKEQLKKICISTVDAFQGQEMDVILFSAVRSNNDQDNIGFLKDRKRLNVAITRAKNALIVFGSANTLVVDQTWQRYVDYHKEKRSFFTVNSQRQCKSIITRNIVLQEVW